MEQTGPLGDTFGGLLSPLIGMVSIYFIYKTFKAQREQLSDQINANRNNESQMYFIELRDSIMDIGNQVKNFNYLSISKIESTGSQAINEFRIEHTSGNYIPFTNHGIFLLFIFRYQVENIIDIINKSNKLIMDGLFTENYKSFLEIRLKSLVRGALPHINTIFNALYNQLLLINGCYSVAEIGVADTTGRDNISLTRDYYIELFRQARELTNLGYVEIKAFDNISLVPNQVSATKTVDLLNSGDMQFYVLYMK